MAYKIAYFSIHKSDDFLAKGDKDYYDDEDYDPNEFPNNGVTRARVNENIAYAALGEHSTAIAFFQHMSSRISICREQVVIEILIGTDNVEPALR